MVRSNYWQSLLGLWLVLVCLCPWWIGVIDAAASPPAMVPAARLMDAHESPDSPAKNQNMGPAPAAPAESNVVGAEISRLAGDEWSEDGLYGTPDYSKVPKERPIPFFDNSTVQTVSAAAGTTAVLQCKVRNLGQMALSWVRKKDYHILTSGRHSFTNDDRFTPLHQEGSDEWLLQIKSVKTADNGTYQCQVATPDGILYRKVELVVVVPEAFILGSKEYHIDRGTAFSLVCIVEKTPAPPEYVFWYHNGKMINYESDRRGLTVSVDRGPKTHSRLSVEHATEKDSGNYTCSAAHTRPDSINVFVSEGDKPAAIQRMKGSSFHTLPWPMCILTTFAVSAIVHEFILR